MPGDAIFDPPPVPLARKPVPIVVYRYLGAKKREILPNIRCTRIRQGIGTKPGSAEFRYVFDRGSVFDTDAEWPTTPEECLGNDKSQGSRYVVEQDERIQVYGFTSKGKPRVLFDGIVQLPSLAISTSAASVTFQALSIPVREWDSPLRQSRYRQADQSSATEPKFHIQVDLPIRFNPDGNGNRTNAGEDFDVHGDASLEYPVFLDWRYLKRVGISDQRKWSVADAASYIIAEGCSDVWVEMPDMADVREVLDSRTGKDGDPYYDPNDSTSYDSKPIIVRDLDVTGLPWPVALEKLITPHGFYFFFDLDQDKDGEPLWKLKIRRFDDASKHLLKVVKLQKYGELVEPAKTNVGQAALTRDNTEIANEIFVESRLKRAEMTFVLAPLFQPDPAHAASQSAMLPFLKGNGSAPQDADNVPMYRDYGLDETMEGHYDFGSSSLVLSGLDIDFKETELFKKANLARSRPGRRTLLSKDDSGNDRESYLEISWDYTGKHPAIWKSGMGGTWYPVPNGWVLLKDQLGIRIDIQNPEAWNTGNKSISFGVNKKSTGGVVKGISAQALAGETRFYLRLTTVVEGDYGIGTVAKKNNTSPTSFTVQRVVDARERYKLDLIDANNPLNTTGDKVLVDDSTEAAEAEAIARQAAHEAPPLAGPIMIPRLDNTYYLGDLITTVEGRDLSLQTNVGNENGQGPRYPRIAGIEWLLEDKQATVLYCTDERGEGRF